MKKIVLFAAAAWLVAACSPKEVSVTPSAPKVFYASTDQATRTYTDGEKVYWICESSYQDAIAVFDHSSSFERYSYSGDNGSTQGPFTADAEGSEPTGEFNYTYAVYPYAEFYKVVEEGLVYAYLHPTQPYWIENINGEDIPSFHYGGRNTMVAVSEDNNLQFKNIPGYLKLRLVGDSDSDTVTKIVVSTNSGEYIAGDVLVSIAPGEEPEIEAYPDEGYINSSIEIPFSVTGAAVLDPSDPLEVWVCMIPGTISGGITVTVSGSSGSQFVYSSSKPLTIKRGICTSTAPLEVDLPVVDNPLFRQYSVEDFYPEGLIENAKGWYGYWNYYASAIDMYSGDISEPREYIGQVTVSRSTTLTEGPDDDGYYDEYVLVNGLFPETARAGIDAVLEMDVYAGIMYAFADYSFNDTENTVYYYSAAQDTFYSGAAWYSAFIPVLDGYYAFVDITGVGYDISGLLLLKSYEAYTNMLLVSPDAAPSPAPELNQAIAKATASFKQSARKYSGIPFASEKERVRATIDDFVSKKAVTGNLNKASFLE